MLEHCCCEVLEHEPSSTPFFIANPYVVATVTDIDQRHTNAYQQ